MLNNQQIKLIQTAIRKAGIRTKDFDGRYRMLLSQYLQSNGQPVTSCKQLNNANLDDLLAICEAHGWRAPGLASDHYRNKVNASRDSAGYPAQQAIKHLAQDLGLGDMALATFVKRMTSNKCDAVISLSPKQAYIITEALKAMYSRREGKEFENLSEIKEYIDNKEGAKDGQKNQR